ncbi:MAG: hypothetical protein J6A21_09565, partial [Lentisphaeria bacterium]|nr:hypothetical protein [Lentisphaeria bacterium]
MATVWDRDESYNGPRLFDADYQENFVSGMNQGGSSRSVLTETDIRYGELSRAMRMDEYVERQLRNDYLYGNGDVVYNPATKTYARKSTNSLYRSGQYADAVRERHRNFDSIRKNYQLDRKDLELGNRLVESEKKYAANPKDENLRNEIGELRSRLGNKEELFRKYHADTAPTEQSENWTDSSFWTGGRGFLGNLSSFAHGNGWHEKDRESAAWGRVDGRLANGYDTSNLDTDYGEMVRKGKKGILDLLYEIKEDPYKIIPFVNHWSFRGTAVEDAAIRLQSYNSTGSGRNLYLLAAKGDQAKADSLLARDRKIVESFKKEQQENLLRGEGLSYHVAGMTKDSLLFGAEIYVTGGAMLDAIPAKMAYGATKMAKGAGLAAKHANKFYQFSKLAAEPLLAPFTRPELVLLMAAGQAKDEITNQALSEDESGNVRYDTSKVNGSIIDRNALISATAEIATEFSGGLLGKVVSKAGVGKYTLGNLERYLAKYIPGGFRSLAKAVHFDGTLEELGEEYLNNLIVYAAGAEAIGAKSQDDFAERMKKFIRTSAGDTPSMLLGFSVLPGLGIAANAGMTAYRKMKSKANYEKLSRALVKAGLENQDVDNFVSNLKEAGISIDRKFVEKVAFDAAQAVLNDDIHTPEADAAFQADLEAQAEGREGGEIPSPVAEEAPAEN